MVQRLMREHRLLQPVRSEQRRRRPGYFQVTRPDELWHLDMTSIWVAEQALHDEEAIFTAEVAALRAAGQEPHGVDPYGFTVSFKGVLLEGLEVAFIVVTFGSNQHNVPLAAGAAGAAVVLVIVAGAAAHAPLSKVPENTLKYAVGVMLTSFGIFWGTEGAGASWPGGDAAILALVAFTLLASIALVAALRRRHRGGAASVATPPHGAGV